MDSSLKREAAGCILVSWVAIHSHQIRRPGSAWSADRDRTRYSEYITGSSQPA